jgi:hypothetical protein
MTYRDRIQAVPCPRCRARAGQPCHVKGYALHNQRRKAAGVKSW